MLAGAGMYALALNASPSPFGALEMNQEKRGKDQIYVYLSNDGTS